MLHWSVQRCIRVQHNLLNYTVTPQLPVDFTCKCATLKKSYFECSFYANVPKETFSSWSSCHCGKTNIMTLIHCTFWFKKRKKLSSAACLVETCFLRSVCFPSLLDVDPHTRNWLGSSSAQKHLSTDICFTSFLCVGSPDTSDLVDKKPKCSDNFLSARFHLNPKS